MTTAATIPNSEFLAVINIVIPDSADPAEVDRVRTAHSVLTCLPLHGANMFRTITLCRRAVPPQRPETAQPSDRRGPAGPPSLRRSVPGCPARQGPRRCHV
jgi:hypothetical protein